MKSAVVETTLEGHLYCSSANLGICIRNMGMDLATIHKDVCSTNELLEERMWYNKKGWCG